MSECLCQPMAIGFTAEMSESGMLDGKIVRCHRGVGAFKSHIRTFGSTFVRILSAGAGCVPPLHQHFCWNAPRTHSGLACNLALLELYMNPTQVWRACGRLCPAFQTLVQGTPEAERTIQSSDGREPERAIDVIGRAQGRVGQPLCL